MLSLWILAEEMRRWSSRARRGTWGRESFARPHRGPGLWRWELANPGGLQRLARNGNGAPRGHGSPFLANLERDLNIGLARIASMSGPENDQMNRNGYERVMAASVGKEDGGDDPENPSDGQCSPDVVSGFAAGSAQAQQVTSGVGNATRWLVYRAKPSSTRQEDCYPSRLC